MQRLRPEQLREHPTVHQRQLRRSESHTDARTRGHLDTGSDGDAGTIERDDLRRQRPVPERMLLWNRRSGTTLQRRHVLAVRQHIVHRMSVIPAR